MHRVPLPAPCPLVQHQARCRSVDAQPDPVEAVRVVEADQGAGQELVPVVTAVAAVARELVPAGTPEPEVVPAARPVAVRADSREHQQEHQQEVPQGDAGAAAPEAVVPVVRVDVVVPADDRRVPASRVARSVASSTIWKLRPLAECGSPRETARP